MLLCRIILFDIHFHLQCTTVSFFKSLRHHTLVLGSSGQLWAFGNGVKGQTGTGRTEDSLTPSLVQFPWTIDSTVAIPNGV